MHLHIWRNMIRVHIRRNSYVPHSLISIKMFLIYSMIWKCVYGLIANRCFTFYHLWIVHQTTKKPKIHDIQCEFHAKLIVYTYFNILMQKWWKKEKKKKHFRLFIFFCGKCSWWLLDDGWCGVWCGMCSAEDCRWWWWSSFFISFTTMLMRFNVKSSSASDKNRLRIRLVEKLTKGGT